MVSNNFILRCMLDLLYPLTKITYALAFSHFLFGTVPQSYLRSCIPGNGGFPSGSEVNNLPAKAGDMRHDSIPGLERSPGGEHGNPLQYSCQENLMDRGVW